MVDHRRADRRFLRRAGPARRQAAHDLRGRRLQAGDLPLPGHQPGKFRPRARALRAGDGGGAARMRASCASRSTRANWSNLGLGRSPTARRSRCSISSTRRSARSAMSNSGSTRPPEPHVGDERPGLVTLWKPVATRPRTMTRTDDAARDRLDLRPERRMADRIARAGQALAAATGFPLVKGRRAQCRAGRHHGAGAQAAGTRRADRRAASRGGRAGGGRRPAAAGRAAGGART